VTQPNIIQKTLDHYPDLFERLETTITPNRAFDTFKTIADVYAPSLTVRYTRGPVVKNLLDRGKAQSLAGENLNFHRNYLNTGNIALEFGSAARKPIWSMAHLDIISFLTRERVGRRYRVTPYCEPRQSNGTRDALALIFSPETGTMQALAQGLLISTDNGKTNYFDTDADNLPPATRVVYASQAEWNQETGIAYGTVDDAFGCAALVLSAMVLSHYAADALIVLTDEEEGVVGVGNRAFSRGSMRLLNRVTPDQLPDIITVTDLHEEVSGLTDGNYQFDRFGQGALFAGFASSARGGVTPPQLLHFQRELAQYLDSRGILLKENAGYVSRSDCVSAMMFTPNVALVGYPGAFSHFADTPRAHVDDLVNLAKVMTVYILLAQNEEWRKQYLL